MRFLKFPTDHEEPNPHKSALENFRNKPRRKVEKTRNPSENAPNKNRGKRIKWTRPVMKKEDGGEE
jgi:hypothetical protein